MKHKLAEKWRVFLVDASDITIPPKIFKKGEMDLTKMDINGILADGKYNDDLGNSFTIIGRAIEFAGLTELALENVQRPGERWKGFLIFEKGNQLKVGGKRTPPPPVSIAAQDEEPWLITKP